MNLPNSANFLRTFRYDAVFSVKVKTSRTRRPQTFKGQNDVASKNAGYFVSARGQEEFLLAGRSDSRGEHCPVSDGGK